MYKELPAIANVKVVPEKDYRLVNELGKMYGIFGTFPLSADMIILNDKLPKADLKVIEAYVKLDDFELHAHTLEKRKIPFPDGKNHYIRKGQPLKFKCKENYDWFRILT